MYYLISKTDMMYTENAAEAMIILKAFPSFCVIKGVEVKENHMQLVEKVENNKEEEKPNEKNPDSITGIDDPDVDAYKLRS